MIETIHDLEAIQETLQLPTWHFAGHSTGGMLGLLYAITYPKSLQSLVVVGAAASNYTETPFCIYHPEHPQFHYMQQLIENLKALTLQMRNEKNYLPNEQNYLYINPKTTILILINQSKTMSASRMNAFAHEYPAFDLREHLPSIQTKTLIICGRHDVQCPLQYSIEMHKGIRNSTFVTFEESNHYPFWKKLLILLLLLEHFINRYISTVIIKESSQSL